MRKYTILYSNLKYIFFDKRKKSNMYIIVCEALYIVTLFLPDKEGIKLKWKNSIFYVKFVYFVNFVITTATKSLIRKVKVMARFN